MSLDRRISELELQRSADQLDPDIADRILRGAYGSWAHAMSKGPPTREVLERWQENPAFDYMLEYMSEHGS